MKAVRSNSQRLQILSGRGCGKTGCIIAKIRYLIEVEGVSPSGVLAIAYSKRASTELKERLNKTLGNRSICTSELDIVLIFFIST